MKKYVSWLFCLALLFVMVSCSKIQEPQFKRIESFKLKNIGLQKADVAFNVVYANPNNFGVSVKEAAIEVYVDSVYMGKFTQPNPVQVGRNADFSVPLLGSIELAKALKLKLENVLNKEVKLSAQGAVKIGKGGVFISQPIKYEGKHKLHIDI